MKKHTLVHKSRRVRRFLWANEAVSALEYAILVGVIATTIGGALVAFSDTISDALDNIGGTVGSVTVTGPTTTTTTPAGP